MSPTQQPLPTVLVEPRHVARLPDGSQEVMIPWSELDPLLSEFDQIVIKARRQIGPEWVEIDKVFLTRPGGGGDAGAPPTRSVELSIQCNQQGHPINPLIYGIANGVGETGETGHRIGGNPMTRHNWELGAWNVGSDWFFENAKGPTGIWEWMDESAAHGVVVAVTVPIIGWVAKDSTSVGFPVAKSVPQRKTDPGRPEAGDGFRPDGKPLASGPPTLTSVAAPPEMIRTWIEKMRQKDVARERRTVAMYILDNEPNLWNTTHRDVHPEPLTYDELLDRTVSYGTAIRAADPDALIAGPAEWGWVGYFYSAKDKAGLIPNLDRAAHGGVPLLPWYLGKLAQHEAKTGTRLIDIVDVHFYPQAPGVYGGDVKVDQETNALRLRSTRALWDPTYRDESWIKEHIELIPRLKDWIQKNYPGRGISIGEWSFGAEDHMSGALAIAEALGRFGQQGITSAFYWSKLAQNTPAFHAFRAYRNFDGKGARFLDWSVPTEGNESVSLFASRDESGSHMVAVLLNLDPDVAADVKINAATCGRPISSRTFAYRSGQPSISEMGRTRTRPPR